MLVHQSNRSCACCGTSVEASIVDIPVQEIKLAPFAVECECGYFYEAYHYAVSFCSWRVRTSILKNYIKDCESDLDIINKIKEELGQVDYRQERIAELEERLKKYVSELESLCVPIPDHLWVEKED